MIDKVRAWVETVAGECKAPVLEVGSYNVNGTVRDLFPVPYIGVDMREGPGVDVVCDVTRGHFADGEFQTIVTTETLEHVTEPWTAIDRMSRWLAEGGMMIVTVPFMFGKHDYPNDYWRMTGDGLRYLFERAGLTCLEAFTDDTHTFGVATK